MYKERADAAGAGGVSLSPNKSSSLSFLPPRFTSGSFGATIRTRSSPPRNVQNDISNAFGQSVAASNALKKVMDNKSKRAGDPPPAHTAPPKKKAKKALG